jgi:cbb3-type cytochrome c oxidase subunit I
LSVQLISDREDSATSLALLTSIFWLFVGVTVGALLAVQFIWPDVVRGIPFLQFGRVRPLHVNILAFGWLSLLNFGAMFYMIPRLCRTSLWNERLANWLVVIWNLAVLGALICLPLGITEGREWAELPWFLDIIVAVGVVMLGVIIFKTIARRKEPQLYVSVWYFAASIVWILIIYAVGNRTFTSWIPGFNTGLNDGIVNWFYAHNVLGLWFTTPGVAIAYYLIPKVTKNPLYSHFLSILGFFTIAMFYAPTGTHHILQAPVPEWAKAISITSSVMLLVPVVTVLVNFFMTFEGKWGIIADNHVARFVFVGAVMYLLTCFTGPLQATRAVNTYLHFTQWVVGHAHLALLGTFSFWGWSAVYYILPRVLKRPMWSKRLITAHFWMAFVGFSLFLIGLTAAGFIQASGWRIGMSVYHTVIMFAPFQYVRMIGGTLLWLSAFVFIYNVYRTAVSAGRPLGQRAGQTRASLEDVASAVQGS